MVVPSLPTLFSDSSRKSVGDGTPISSPMLLNHISQDIIFFFSPWAFRHELFIFQFEPSVEALNFGTTRHAFAYLIPSRFSELFNEAHQLNVLNHKYYWIKRTYFIWGPCFLFRVLRETLLAFIRVARIVFIIDLILILVLRTFS